MKSWKIAKYSSFNFTESHTSHLKPMNLISFNLLTYKFLIERFKKLKSKIEKFQNIRYSTFPRASLTP